MLEGITDSEAYASRDPLTPKAYASCFCLSSPLPPKGIDGYPHAITPRSEQTKGNLIGLPFFSLHFLGCVATV